MNKFKNFINFICDVYIYTNPMFFIYKPMMHKVKGHEIRQILDEIKVGDILLRKFDGYLNTFFTPGFWSHAGIYIGNNTMAHAVREGVIEEDILDYCRTDSVALIRLKEHYHFNEETMLKYAEEHINNNTEYDYDFKDDNGKVYCTEFVNICLGYIFDMDYEPKIVKAFSHKIRFLLPDSIFNSDKVDKILVFKN